MAKTNHEVQLNKLLDEGRLTPHHWRVWALSAMGVFLDGFDLFVIGVALPVLKHDPSWHVTPVLEGALGIAALLGAVVGASVAGYLTDRFGRKTFYIADLAFVIVAAVMCGVAWDIYSLIAFRFILGIAIGADYPISASYISEFVPSRIRGRMLIAGFSFQALGMLCAALSGMLILQVFNLAGDPLASWRFMLMFVIIPASIVMFLRMSVPESPRWLLAHGKTKKAAKILHTFLPEKVPAIQAILKQEVKVLTEEKKRAVGYAALFSKKYIRRTILAAGPWFCMDIATYGIGIFTPVLLASMVHSGAGHSFFSEEWHAVSGAAFVDVFLVLGFGLNILLVEKLGRMRLQLIGFAGMVFGLCLLASTSFMGGGASHNLVWVFSGFIIFNLLMNMGPNSTTYMLPVELFPTEARASGHGFGAAAAKTGAAVGTICLPVLKSSLGTAAVLFIVAGMAALGFLITVLFRVETTGASLDEIDAMEVAGALEAD